MIRYIGNHLKKGSVALTVPFHMTSRQPCWYSKTMQPRAFWVFQTNPMGVELFSNANAFSGHVVENALLVQNEP